ncbi:MAG: sigma-70 family RNA polymerase sigma factor [Chitinophagaceae bacterium]
MEQVNSNIIAGCKKGDRKSQELLYRNYYKAMMALCLMYTKNDADAVEVLNGGFLKVFLNLHRYDPTHANLYTWIRTIIINNCLDFIKSKSRNQQPGELNRAIEVYINAEAIEKMDAAMLLDLVRKLPPATQAVFQLYVIEGYNHKEIGSLVHISEGTSKWHLSEARKSLQQMIRMQEVKL